MSDKTRDRTDIFDCLYQSPEVAFSITRTPQDGLFVRVGCSAYWYSEAIPVKSGEIPDALITIASIAKDHTPDSVIAKWYIDNIQTQTGG